MDHRICEIPFRKPVSGMKSFFDGRFICQDDFCVLRFDCCHSVFCDEEEPQCGDLLICSHGNASCARGFTP